MDQFHRAVKATIYRRYCNNSCLWANELAWTNSTGRKRQLFTAQPPIIVAFGSFLYNSFRPGHMQHGNPARNSAWRNLSLPICTFLLYTIYAGVGAFYYVKALHLAHYVGYQFPLPPESAISIATAALVFAGADVASDIVWHIQFAHYIVYRFPFPPEKAIGIATAALVFAGATLAPGAVWHTLLA